ncbi:MAG: insulinase family protein [Bdellovibrionaceae bacterium]|nr:insulinase family protein [Bdellovibrionales bacterium]MCB9082875.1 insulinase family protein [Pseudobdellovibrionaceae bacterium]
MTAFDFQPVFKKTTLDNGVRVVTEHHPFSRATSAAVYVDLGTRDEPKHLNGAAHFVEHLVFKGTKERSAFEIAKSLEAVGGELNAYTSREYTCFHATSLREHMSLSLDVLVDLATQAVFAEEEFGKEREVIEQEIDMSADLLEEYIFDLYFEHAYKGHSLGLPILGTRQSLHSMTRNSLFDFYDSRYGGKNLLVSVAGDVDHDRVLELVEKSLSQTRSKVETPKRDIPRVEPFSSVIHRPSEQIHLLAGMPSGSFVDPRRFEAYIVNALLGGGMTSRLYQKVREEQGLVYSIYSYLHTFTDSGLIMVYAGTSAKNAPVVLQNMAEEMKRLRKEGMTQEDLDFFKTQVKGTILLGADDIENRMNSIAVNEMIFQRYRPVEEIVEEIDRISVDSIREYIDDNFKPENRGVMVMGDVDEATAQSWVSAAF